MVYSWVAVCKAVLSTSTLESRDVHVAAFWRPFHWYLSPGIYFIELLTVDLHDFPNAPALLAFLQQLLPGAYQPESQVLRLDSKSNQNPSDTGSDPVRSLYQVLRTSTCMRQAVV